MPAIVDPLVPVLEQLVVALQHLVQVLQGMVPAPGASASVGQSGAGQANLAGPCGSPAQAGAAWSGGMSSAAGAAAVAGPAPAPAPMPAQAPAPPTQSAPLVSGPQRHSKQENALVVADVARQMGVDPVLAVATMLVESNGDNTNRTGDGGTSFGLFQLHVGGQLPKEWYPGEPGHDNAFDPRRNAETALSRFAANKDQFSGPELAFRSQRPANHDKYVAAIEQRMGEARQLLGM